jgi:hypothetical protein
MAPLLSGLDTMQSQAAAKMFTTSDAPRVLGTKAVPQPSPWFHPSGTAALAILLLVIVSFGAIRYRLRNMPLERDEGEYAYSGQLLLEGVPPYKLAYNMKLPGIYAAYAAILAVFGETPAGIHLGLLLINAASVVLLYILTSLLFDRFAGLVAAISYALLSTSSSVMGFEAHATAFVVPFALAGILFAVLAEKSGRTLWFWSGLCSGIAFLMKQHGIFFVGFCGLYLCWRTWKEDRSLLLSARRAATFLAGAMIPYGLTCLLLYRAGVFRTFWFWTVSYAGEYSKIGMRRAIHEFVQNSAAVTRPAVFVWIVAAVGVITLWNPIASRYRFFTVTLLLFSFASLCPGGYFRPHYFVLLLPGVALLAGIAVSCTAEMMGASRQRQFACAPILVFAVAFASSVVGQRQDYFFKTPESVFDATYPGSPFRTAQGVADYLEQRTFPSDRIAVIGSEPEIYFYSHRHSATGYLYMYSLIGHQKYLSRMQDQMLRELRQNHPQYLIYVDVWDSWGDRSHAPEASGFLNALNDFMNSQYERVGVADIGPATQYVWGEKALTYVPRSTKAIYVLKRRRDRVSGVLS